MVPHLRARVAGRPRAPAWHVACWTTGIEPRSLFAAVKSLARSDDGRGLFAQLGGAAAMSSLPLWPLAGSSGPLALAFALLAASIFEPLVAPWYFARQDEAFGGLGARPSLSHGALRASAAILPALLLRAVAAAVGSLPGLALEAIAHASSNAALHETAADVGAIGAGLGLFAACVGTSFATRAAVLEDASPLEALLRSLTMASSAPMKVAGAQLLGATSALALVFTVRVPPLFAVALLARWARDVALTGAMREAPPSREPFSLAWAGVAASDDDPTIALGR